jgi:iron complex outermembrane receptor protein
MPRSLALAAALLSFSAQLPAQHNPTPDSARQLPTTTVTATRSVKSILTTPLAVNKVQVDELRNTSGYGLEDALSSIPGVIAQSRYGTSDVRLIIRGFGARGAGDRSNSGTSRGVRVMLDGFPETEPDGRTAFDHVDLATVEAAEVIRSNASALYGNAAGGVVHLVSVPSASAPNLDVQPIVGAFGLRRIATRTSASFGNSGTVWGSFTNSTVDGWRKHSDARRALVNAGAIGNIGEHTRLGAYLVASNNLMHIPGPLTPTEYAADASQANATYASRDERRYNRQGRLGLTLDHAFGSSASISSSFYVNPKYLQRSERNTFRDFTRYHLGGSVLGRKDVALGSQQHRLMLGFDEAYQDGSIQFYALTNNTRGALTDNTGEGAQNVGVFAQDELTLTDRLTLLLGARWDRVAYNYRTFFNPAAAIRAQSKDFTRVSPKLGVNWRFASTHALYANVGGGLEVPAGNETDQPPTGPLPGALLNPLLDAIRSTTYEMGYKATAVPLAGGAVSLEYEAAVYHTDVANEIIPYNGGRYYQTAASARRRGAEVEVEADAAAGIFASAALTLNDHIYDRYVVDSSVINAANPNLADLSGNRVMGVPKVFGTFELGTEVPGFRALTVKGGVEHSGQYFADDKNSVTVPAYTIFNVTAALKRPIVAANGVALRAFVTVHNVTNRKYVGSAFLNPDTAPSGEPAVYEPGAPRAVTLSLSLGYR